MPENPEHLPVSHIYAGIEVRVARVGSGVVDVLCPACAHWTRGVAVAALATNPNQPLNAPPPIACACATGAGARLVGPRTAIGCLCRLSYALQPLGAPNSGRYVVRNAQMAALTRADEPERAPEPEPVAEVTEVAENATTPTPTPARRVANKRPVKAVAKLSKPAAKVAHKTARRAK